MIESKRLVYVDCIRGLCILLVIYHHFILMGMRGFNYQSSVEKFMYFFFLPLFFFISGFFAWKTKKMWNLKDTFLFIIKKIRSILVPTVVFFLVCMQFFHLNIFDWLFVSFKSGYWFTWCLFQMFLCLSLFNFIVYFFKLEKFSSKCIFLLFFLAIIGNLASRFFHESNPIVGLLSADLTLKYFVFFVFGIIVKCNFSRFEEYLSNRFINAFLLIIAFSPLCFKINSVMHIPVVFAQILGVFRIFSSRQNYFNGKNVPSNFLATCGKYSLSIYFLHYFLLFKTPQIALWLQTFQTDYCFRGPSCVGLLEFLIIGFLSALIAVCCIMIKKAIDAFPFISELCFGPNSNK